MKGWFNGKKVNIEKISFTELQRGFDYGDGLFETIFLKNGEPLLLKYHLDRLKMGLEVLEGSSDDLQECKVYEQLKVLWNEEGKADSSSAKIRIWREPNLGYGTTGKRMNSLITLRLSDPFKFNQISSFGLITVVQNHLDPLSRFKTLSSLPYVLAGQEQLRNKWDEGLILDQRGFLSEGISSNLFVLINGIWHTPPLGTGCVEGVMRRYLMEDLKELKFQEADLNPTEIDLKNQLWLTVNSLVLNYFLPKGVDDAPLKTLISKLIGLTT